MATTNPETTATQAEPAPRVSNRAVVLQAILDLCASNRHASRGAIVEVTGLKLGIVDEHVKTLKEDGQIRAVIPGVFEPVETSPDRAVSGTVVPSGRFKLEIGDTCLDLTLREARAVAMVTAGAMALGAGWPTR